MATTWILNTLIFITTTLAAGGAAMIFHGFFRCLRGQPFTKCVTRWAGGLVAGGVFATCLWNTLADGAPDWEWGWVRSLILLAAMAPSLLAWLGPPSEHVEGSGLCQIGKGCAYSHFYGYLVLMQKENGIRRRLEAFKRENRAGLSIDSDDPSSPRRELADFHSKAVVVLAPADGSKYPSDSFSSLNGVGKCFGALTPFKKQVGSNERTYGGFGIYEVKSSDGQRKLLALDDIGALKTLQKLGKHAPRGFTDDNCKQQMKEMLDELQKIIEDNDFLDGQLKLVRYSKGEHVGDAILTAIAE